MAVSTRKLLYDIRRKLNSFNTGAGQSYTVLDLVSILNEAYEIVVENGIKMADTDNYYKNSLRKLEVKYKELTLKNKGEYIFAEYPTDLYKRQNHYVIAKCDTCEGTKNIIPRIVQPGDLHEARKNPYRQANYAWEQLIADESNSGLYLYPDNKLDIDKVYIDYYRKINYLEAPSLVECSDYQYLNYDDKLIVNDVNFDLDDTYIARRLPDIAVLLANADTRNSESFKLRLEQIMAVNRIS